ncbi:MAG: RNA polymerase sigma factor [Solirubrobacterales bacterium]
MCSRARHELGRRSDATAEHTPGTPANTPDERLVARASDGDVAAFEALVRRHADRLYGVLLKVTSDRGDAEDALQETFVRAWRNIAKFESRSTFFTWLYRIGVNEAKRRLERRPPPEIAAATDDNLDRVRDHRPRPAQLAERHELLDALDSAVKQLEPEYRVPLVLRDIEGFSTHEAASIMGLGEAAFKSRLHRARMSVRGSLEPLLEADHNHETKSAEGGSKR